MPSRRTGEHESVDKAFIGLKILVKATVAADQARDFSPAVVQLFSSQILWLVSD